MQNLIIQIINQYGYIGISLLIAIENIFPPIPSEVILTFGGFITTYTSINIWGVILSATVGSLLGALVLYGIGRWLKAERLEQWVNGKWGKLLHFKKEDISKAVDKFSTHGKSTIFFCRFIPIVRSLISIPAGIAKMNMVTFLTLTAAGTFIWNVVLVYLGSFAGASWEKIVEYMNTYSAIAVVAILILATIAALLFYKKRFTKKIDN